MTATRTCEYCAARFELPAGRRGRKPKYCPGCRTAAHRQAKRRNVKTVGAGRDHANSYYQFDADKAEHLARLKRPCCCARANDIDGEGRCWKCGHWLDAKDIERQPFFDWRPARRDRGETNGDWQAAMQGDRASHLVRVNGRLRPLTIPLPGDRPKPRPEAWRGLDGKQWTYTRRDHGRGAVPRYTNDPLLVRKPCLADVIRLLHPPVADPGRLAELLQAARRDEGLAA